jgi:hypothetical protein
MPALGFVVPVLPGKEQADLDWMEEMTGPRREEYESAWKQLGVTRHTVWHQQTPDGTVAVVYMEADDIPRACKGSRRPTTRSTSGSESGSETYTGSTSRRKRRRRLSRSTTTPFRANSDRLRLPVRLAGSAGTSGRQDRRT